jgi:hypothetical protein
MANARVNLAMRTFPATTECGMTAVVRTSWPLRRWALAGHEGHMMKLASSMVDWRDKSRRVT